MLWTFVPSWLQLSISGFLSKRALRLAAACLALARSGAKAKIVPADCAPKIIVVKHRKNWNPK